MVKRGEGGAILAISSSHAIIPFATAIAYGTCKAGINHMTHTMAEELLKDHIRANVLEPGWIDTPGERKFMTEDQIKEKASRLPWGRMGTIQEMAKAATFLCSDDASYITGATLRADGGFWLPSRGISSIKPS
jgi:glucose 1-dehydrogenase